jgi:L-arabinose isomerase
MNAETGAKDNAGRDIKIGLFGIGLETYWAQFDGLEQRLKGFHKAVREKMGKLPMEIIDAGLVDNMDKAAAAGALFKKEDVGLLFLHISTYALSSTVLPIVRSVRAPVVILNLQPQRSIDFEAFNRIGDAGKMTGEWLANCQACSVPEISSVLIRSGIEFHIVTGYLDDEEAWREIHAWMEASRVAAMLEKSRFGILGRYYGGMLDVYTDLTRMSAVFGSHFELLEMCELKRIRDGIPEGKVAGKLGQFDRVFEVSAECPASELRRAALTSCAMDELIEHRGLGGFAYYYEGTPGNDYENIATSLIAGNSLLTANHVPVAGECEVKNVLAMKILDCFDAGGSFSEFYGLDFKDDIVLLGHDGPAHFAIAEGRVGLVPLPVYHGKPGKGLSIQMTVRHGPVTLLSVVEGREGVFLLAAEGESVEGPVFNIGNTNSRYRFALPAGDFINRWSMAGPAHHCAVGTGHVARKIEKLAAILGIECVKIC